MCVLVSLAKHDIQALELRKEGTLVSPDVELLNQFRNDQERTPSTDLLGLENVPKDVVTNVENIFSLSPNQLRENITRT